MRTPTQDKLAPPVGKYVVYDPPADDLPYVAVLFLPEQRPKLVMIEGPRHGDGCARRKRREREGETADMRAG